MSAANDGGPAFPVREADRFNPQNNETHTIEQHWGMSLRDWFAGKALVGLLGNPNWKATPEKSDIRGDDRYAWQAYMLADAMLKVRGGAS